MAWVKGRHNAVWICGSKEDIVGVICSRHALFASSLPLPVSFVSSPSFHQMSLTAWWTLCPCCLYLLTSCEIFLTWGKRTDDSQPTYATAVRHCFLLSYYRTCCICWWLRWQKNVDDSGVVGKVVGFKYGVVRSRQTQGDLSRLSWPEKKCWKWNVVLQRALPKYERKTKVKQTTTFSSWGDVLCLRIIHSKCSTWSYIVSLNPSKKASPGVLCI